MSHLIARESNGSKQKAKVYPYKYKKRGFTYHCFIVRGWKVGGKWQRKQFKNEKDAEAEALRVNSELLAGSKAETVMRETTLSKAELRQAENALAVLGGVYSLEEAAKFFILHHRPPEFTISLEDGIKEYIDIKEFEGVREPTRKTTQNILKAFAKSCGNPEVHTVTANAVGKYLRSLKSKDGETKAKKKTWNNHRNELASFFGWAEATDISTNRPWTFNNPVSGFDTHSVKRVAEERPAIVTTAPDKLVELFSYLMTYKNGKLVKWFALAYFTGIRPSTNNGELVKLATKEKDLINLETNVITIPASVSKVKDERTINISPNLRKWLKAYEGYPISPPNLKNDYRHVRQLFNLQSDEPRHSFITYHVALHRSVGDVALQAGNSERIIKKHYLNHRSLGDGEKFFSVVPDTANGVAVYSKKKITSKNDKNLKVV